MASVNCSTYLPTRQISKNTRSQWMKWEKAIVLVNMFIFYADKRLNITIVCYFVMPESAIYSLTIVVGFLFPYDYKNTTMGKSWKKVPKY